MQVLLSHSGCAHIGIQSTSGNIQLHNYNYSYKQSKSPAPSHKEFLARLRSLEGHLPKIYIAPIVLAVR